MKFLGLEGMETVIGADLSYGGQRLVDLGIALGSKPLVLLMDEPLAGLAAAERERISHLIKTIASSIPVLIVEHDIDRVFMVAPSSTPARIAAIVGVTTGFVYAASTMGVTGARTTVSSGAHDLVSRTREHTSLPIAVGLGVSTGDQAAEIAAYADGVIVGSAFVRRVLDAPTDEAAIAGVSELAQELAAGVRRST
jgi:tryptophan synthase alpha subunit